VDHFKSLNDEYGHVAGDGVLSRVAAKLAGGLRPQDLLARYGGDEFAALLPEADAVSARSIADRLRQTIELRPDDERSSGPAVTVSIGVASRRPHETVATLLERADQALYRAKRAGRNGTSE
jgi:diguanylate cyclase (GGDEF)-like protein